MLLKFSVANHRSISEKQDLSMIVSSRRDHDRALLPWPSETERRVLPVAVIYGANASGKSSVLGALERMRGHVRHSHKRDDPEGDMRRRPFLLDPKIEKQPTLFECDFVDHGERLHYGFEISNTEVVREWLHAFPNGRRQALFQRDKQKFKFSRLLGGQKLVISRLTRPNSLYVSAGAQNDHPMLSRISSYFTGWRGDVQAWVPGGIASQELAKESIDPRVVKFLAQLGTGVVEHRTRSKQLPKELAQLSVEISQFIQDKLKQLNKGRPKAQKLDTESMSHEIVVELGHRAIGGKTIFFDLDIESDGTRRLLLLLRQAYQAIDSGTLLVVDELDANLHTHACVQILNLFLSRKTNPKGAQLVTTTHDTNLLNLKHLRRDEMWIAEKDEFGSTELSSFADFQTRQTDNLERGYLQGRFGGVPPQVVFED